MSRIRHEVRVLYSPALFLVLPRQISTLRYLRLVLQQNKNGVNIASKADFLGRLYFVQ